MIAKAMLTHLEARTGREDDLRELLSGARGFVVREPATALWFAYSHGHDEYGVFSAFADEAGRDAHLDGAIAHALTEVHDAVLVDLPDYRPADTLAHKMPAADGFLSATKGMLLGFKARQGHEEEVATLLRDALRWVDDEPGTRAWFALQYDAQHFGVFGVFPDNGTRFTHLVGHFPRELASHALTLLGGMPELHLLDVVAYSYKPMP